MSVQPFPGGYDPNSGQPPDDSTGNVWGDDVDLSQYGKFWKGGFANNPKPIMGDLSAQPDVMGPGSQNLRPGMSPTVRNGPGPFTDATTNGGGGFLDWLKRGAGALGAGAGPAAVPALAAAAAAAGYKWGNPALQKMSVDPRLAAAADPFNVNQPLGSSAQPMMPPRTLTPAQPMMPPRTPTPAPNAPIDPYGPTRVNAPIDPYGNRAPVPNGPFGPSVTNRPQDRPSYAGPAVAPSAVAAQRPNLGYYNMDRPNMPAGGNARGGGGPANMGVFGFDPRGPLFGMGANAPPPGPLAAAVNPAAAPALPNPAPMPPPRPWPTQAPVPMPPPRPRNGSTSSGGLY